MRDFNLIEPESFLQYLHKRHETLGLFQASIWKSFGVISWSSLNLMLPWQPIVDREFFHKM